MTNYATASQLCRRYMLINRYESSHNAQGDTTRDLRLKPYSRCTHCWRKACHDYLSTLSSLSTSISVDPGNMVCVSLRLALAATLHSMCTEQNLQHRAVSCLSIAISYILPMLVERFDDGDILSLRYCVLGRHEG